jgi:hypothetical protein
MMWLMKFFLLSAAYAAIMLLVLAAAAKIKGEDVGVSVEEALRDNNTYFFLLFGATMITFIISLNNPGRPLVPDGILMIPGVGWVVGLVLFGKNLPAKEILAGWFWMEAAFMYAILTVLYIPIAMHDEAEQAWDSTMKKMFPGNQGGQATAAPGSSPMKNLLGGGNTLVWAIVADFLIGFFWNGVFRKGGGRP